MHGNHSAQNRTWLALKEEQKGRVAAVAQFAVCVSCVCSQEPYHYNPSSCLLSEFQNETVTKADHCNPFKSNPAQFYLLHRGTSA